MTMAYRSRSLRTSSFGLLLVTLSSGVAGVSGCGHQGAPAATPKPTTAAPAMAKEQGAKTPSFTAANIDAAIHEEWKKANVTPAPRADDATFLRRIYVDIVGTIPPPDVTTKFLADTSPDKRAKMVDTLLASPEYAEHWMNYWDDVLMGSDPKGAGNMSDRSELRAWLRARFAENAPWNAIVREIISATGQNSDGGPKTRGAQISMQPARLGAPTTPAAQDEEPVKSAPTGPVNGAVNWTLRFEKNPQDIGGTASRIFLGVQIQCAQCHDHKTEAWKQEDFRRFSNAFFHAKIDPLDKGKPMGIRRVELEDFAGVPPRYAKNAELQPIARAKATALDGTSLDKGKDTRKALAAWMTSKDNKWFAKAFANRMWGHFLGRGFWDPVDDMRPSNPPTMPELLDKIAADFAAHDFDIKQLIRTMCATEVYQLASSAQAKTGEDRENKLWGRFHLVPLGPEELLNAIVRATDLDVTAQRAGIKDLDALRLQIVKQYAFLFDTDEENDEPDYSGTVSQALALLNGQLVGQSTRALPGSVVQAATSGPGTDAEKVDLLSVRVLGRHATPEEQARLVKYIETADARSADAAKAPPSAANKKNTSATIAALNRLGNRRGAAAAASPKVAAYEDIVWSMLNSSEFTFNH